jgi:hypothetical protein
MKTHIKNLLLLLLLLGLPGVVQAQDAYSTNADGSIDTYSTNADGSANIVAYAGPPWVVTIPTNINGLTVTSIGDYAFAIIASPRQPPFRGGGMVGVIKSGEIRSLAS